MEKQENCYSISISVHGKKNRKTVNAKWKPVSNISNACSSKFMVKGWCFRLCENSMQFINSKIFYLLLSKNQPKKVGLTIAFY